MMMVRVAAALAGIAMGLAAFEEAAAQYYPAPYPSVSGRYRVIPLPDDDDHDLADLLAWMGEHLEDDQSVAQLARRAHMSERTFARRFRAETGTTPHHWLTWQRVLHAQRLLETTELDVDRVAERSGFRSAATLRHHFVGRVGTSPQRYRRTFRRTA